jgi:acyl-CoA synthetase (AMP-forming)/AMP-acid ligase II/acyl carrier protein
VAQGITISFVPTALCERLIALPWPAETALRVLLTGADTLHHYPPHNLPFILVNNYGPTECTVVATSGHVLSGKRLDRLPTIGRPISNTQIYILNEQLEQVPIGTMGELYIGGVGLARGYLNRPGLTAQSFLPNPFISVPGARLYRTGDLARFLSDGQIEFLGRIDEQVKIRGYRIEPQEIVTVLDAHPRVRASLVVAREDTPGDKRLVAYVVAVPQSYLTDTDLRDFLRTQLPQHMLPAVFVALGSLPLTPSGKADRAALPAPNDANILRDEVFVPPRTPVEERLAAIVAPLLHLERIGVNDNFFLLGGHSLLGTQLVSRVRETFGVELTLLSLFDNPTIEGMSGLIERLLIARVEGMSGDEVWRVLAPSQWEKET